jgi:3-hydroxyisobutyrate dehydrogenase
MARLLGFPVPLCAIAEQVYFAGADRGWGSQDDAGLVRLWTSEPVSNIQTSLSDEEKNSKLDLVINLLTGIHLVAVAESIAFAKHVDLPLQQLYELAVEAAGGSTMFKKIGEKVIPILEGQSGGDESLGGYVDKLKGAVDEAQRIKCPSYLGGGALNLLLASGKDASLSGLLKFYTVGG